MINGIFDSHTHLNDDKYEELGWTTEEMVLESKHNGVNYMCCVGFDVKSSKKAVTQASKYNGIFAAVGIHPTEAHKTTEKDIEEIEVLANANKVVAIGEIGLDYYHEPEHAEIQKELFRKQIDIALSNNLTVMMHIRDVKGSNKAYLDALDIIKSKGVKKSIVHCFTQNIRIAKLFLDFGSYISIPGVVTFKNSQELQDAVKEISINKLLVETDAPYLAPEPYRASINQPKYIINTVSKIAELKKMNKEEVANITSENAKNIFGINK